MSEPLAATAANVFRYAADPIRRRHGPRGYASYESYKPWLRDEFQFRCVYCLCRERWEPNGQAVFTVEHIEPQTALPERRADCDNVLYACLVCNACRQDEPLPFDPCREPLGHQLQVLSDGMAEAMTVGGRRLIDLCHLNRQSLVVLRRYILTAIEWLIEQRRSPGDELVRSLLRFPDDLPDLNAKRPPGGNDRPAGIVTSFHEQR